MYHKTSTTLNKKSHGHQEKAKQFYEAQRFKLWKRRPLENLSLDLGGCHGIHGIFHVNFMGFVGSDGILWAFRVFTRFFCGIRNVLFLFFDGVKGVSYNEGSPVVTMGRSPRRLDSTHLPASPRPGEARISTNWFNPQWYLGRWWVWLPRINGQTVRIFVVFGDLFQKTSEGINTQYFLLVSGWFFTWCFLTSQRSCDPLHAAPGAASDVSRTSSCRWSGSQTSVPRRRCQNVVSVPWFFSTKHGRFDKHGDLLADVRFFRNHGD